MPSTLIFLDEYTKELERKFSSFAGASDEILLLTLNEKTFLSLRSKSYPVYFLPELFTLEDIQKTDRECIDFVRSAISSKQNNRFEYRDIPMGYVVEFYFLPYFIRVFRDIFLIDKALERFKGKRIIVSGAGGFCKTARLLLRQRGIPYESLSDGVFRHLTLRINDFWQGRKNRWVGKPFKDIFMESALNFGVIADSYLSKLSSALKGNKSDSSSENCLVFSADTHTFLVSKLLQDKGWNLLSFGIDYRYRKRMLKGIKPMEGYANLSHIAKASMSFLHFLFSWMQISRDRGFINKFEYMGVGYWDIIKHRIRDNMLITFPRMFLDYSIASDALSKCPNAVLAVFAEEPPYNKIVIHAAREHNVKSLVILHGVLAQSNGHDTIGTDYYAAWGRRAFEWFGRFDANAVKKIHVTGAPRYDGYSTDLDTDRDETLKTLDLPVDKKIILIITAWSQNITVASTDMEDIYMIDTVVNALSDLKLEKECHVVVKPHPAGDPGFLENYCNTLKERFPGISVINGYMKELIYVSDACISGYSTTVLETMFFKKPSVIFSRFMKTELVPYAAMGASLRASTPEEMAAAIMTVFNDSDAVSAMTAKQQDFVEYAAYKLDGHSTERVAKLIELISSGKQPTEYL